MVVSIRKSSGGRPPLRLPSPDGRSAPGVRVNRLAARWGKIATAQQARQQVRQWLERTLPTPVPLHLGLPEVDGRYGVWRDALPAPASGVVVGEASTADNGYEVTTVGYAPPVFPWEVVERPVRYYSFIGDGVLDTFSGMGTVGKACQRLGRRLILIDVEPRYCATRRRALAVPLLQNSVDDGQGPSESPKG
ncbi:hypothetical protein HRbin23_00364 [bacterium HR23]|nr:hypothetical protein HRbin23_00364 [bacterium HR23]